MKTEKASKKVSVDIGTTQKSTIKREKVVPAMNSHATDIAVTICKQKKFSKKSHAKFPTKQQALDYMGNSGINELKLFSEDLSPDNGSKRFIVSTYDNIYVLSTNKNMNMYENYEANQELKLVLDIDYKLTGKLDDDHDDKLAEERD